MNQSKQPIEDENQDDIYEIANQVSGESTCGYDSYGDVLYDSSDMKPQKTFWSSQQPSAPLSPPRSCISNISSTISASKNSDVYDHVEKLLSRGQIINDLEISSCFSHSESNLSSSSTFAEFDHVQELLNRGSGMNSQLKDDHSVSSFEPKESIRREANVEFDQSEALKPPAFYEDNHELSPENVKLDNPFALDDKQESNPFLLDQGERAETQNETNGLSPEEEFVALTKTQEELNEAKELNSLHQKKMHNPDLTQDVEQSESDSQVKKESLDELKLNDSENEESNIKQVYKDEEEDLIRDTIEHRESETDEEIGLTSGNKPQHYPHQRPRSPLWYGDSKKKIIIFISFLILIIIIILAVVIPKNKNSENETPDNNNVQPSNILKGTQNFNMFGKSLSISDSGNRMLVAGNSDTSLLYIYNVILDNEIISTMLNYTLKKQNTDVVSASSAKLSGDGNHLVLSSKLNDASSLAQVFSLSSGGLSWIQMGEDIGGFQDNLSLSISNDGLIIAVGAPSLSVNVYEFVDEKWSLVGSNLTGSPDVVGFGTRISLSSDGSRIAVGTMVTGTAEVLNGYTSVYNFNGTDWFEFGNSILIDAGASNDIYYAQTVSLNAAGDRLAICYPGYSWNSNDLLLCGLCRVYKYDFDDDDNVMKWMRIGESIIGESNSEKLGKVVSLSGNGNMVAISSSGNKVNVYEVLSDNVEFSGSFVSNDETFGTDNALSSDGTELLIGAPGGGNENLYGETYLYSLASSL